MTWQDFLNSQHARFDTDGSVLDFGVPELAVDDAVMIDVSPYTFIEVSGADAPTFLQGQFTADVRQVTPEHSQLSAWCNAKGRVLVNFRLFQRENAYYLWLPRSLAEATLKRLRMYVLRAKVSLRQADELAAIAVSRIDFSATFPTQDHGVYTQQGLSQIRLSATRCLYVAEQSSLQALWLELAARARPSGFATWQLEEILAGVPWISPATVEAFVPQMIRYDSLGGVSFNKGCYTGQEVVARSHFLGSLKRHCYRLRLDVNAPAGNAIHAPGDDSAGLIVNSAPHPAGDFISLAVLKDSASDAALTCGEHAVRDLSLLS
jgi:tRNA-modifying protein YgfZ